MSIEVMTDRGVWDRFIDESPYGLLFHKWDFLKIVERHTGYNLLPYGVYKGSELICVCPFFLKRQMGVHLVFSPPPRVGVPYLGFVMSPTYDQLRQRRKESYLGDAIREINGELLKLSPNYVSLVTVPGFEDVRPFLWAGYDAGIYYTYVIDLRQPLDEIWSGFDHNCKKNIKLCNGHALELRASTGSREFYDLLAARYGEQKLRVPIVSAEYLQDLLAVYPDNLKLHYLYEGEHIVAAELNCQYKGRVMQWLGNTIVQKDVPANYYMRWESIKKAKADGFQQFEIQGADTQRLCPNKAGFNPALARNFNIYRKDAMGLLAEWTYQTFVKKRLAGLG